MSVLNLGILTLGVILIIAGLQNKSPKNVVRDVVSNKDQPVSSVIDFTDPFSGPR